MVSAADSISFMSHINFLIFVYCEASGGDAKNSKKCMVLLAQEFELRLVLRQVF